MTLNLRQIILSTIASLVLLAPAPLAVLADSTTPTNTTPTAPTTDPTTTPPADTTPPTAPTNLAASAASPTEVDLTWTAATDNVGVTGYKVIRGGVTIATVGSTTTYADTQVAVGTSYTYVVEALDAAGNVSPDSNSATVTTPQPPAPTPPSSSGAGQTGPTQTTGSAPSYAFNDATGKWEPTIVSSFTWDATSGLWESPFYTYDSATGWYHVKPQVTPSAAINGLTSGSADPAGTLAKILGTNDPSNSNTGPNSLNNSSLTNNNTALLNLLTQYQVNNNLGSNAQSGDVNVTNNTNALGAAKSGAATVVANLLNLLNSMWSWASGGLGYFVDNVFGNQTGDITINPQATSSGSGGSVGALPACSGGLSQNQTTGPGSNNNATSTCNDGLTVNSQSSGNINNNVNLAAQSGKVNVSGNTNAGNAMSGEAAAELNIVNLINTAIGANYTFFGLVNIFGNLNGDILFPQGFLNNAVATSSQPDPSAGSVSNSNTGPGSANNANANNANNLAVTNNTNGAFNNDINASANSGAVNVTGNTTAGSAQSGNADTNTNTFNLFNTGIFGDNAILVLVNDLGHWVGQIMNLSDFTNGSAAGLLTGNATVTNSNTGPGSNNNASVNNSNDATINNTANGTINNRVTATANSGDVTVSDNTNAGDARSGNASVASNVANFFGSTLNLKKWFGILIINVFGNWTGDVNNDTAAGSQPVTGGKGGGAPVTAFLVSALDPPAQPWTSSGSVGAGNSVGGASTAGNGVVAFSGQKVSATAAAPKLVDHSQEATASRHTGVTLEIAAAFLLIAAALFGLDSKRRRA